MHSTTFIAALAVSSVHADAKITEIAPNIRGATHVEQSYLVQCGEYNKQKKCDKDQMCKWNDSNQCVPSNKEDSPEEVSCKSILSFFTFLCSFKNIILTAHTPSIIHIVT